MPDLGQSETSPITDEMVERMASWLAIRDDYDPNEVVDPATEWPAIRDAYRRLARQALEAVFDAE